MGHVIIKIKDCYLEWSTVVDAPVAFGMTLPALRRHIAQEYGRTGLRELPSRLARVEKVGISSTYVESLAQWLAGNHAGPAGSPLTPDEIHEAYCLRQPIRGGWIVPARDDPGDAVDPQAADIKRLTEALVRIQAMAAEDLREGRQGDSLYQIEADARAALAENQEEVTDER